MDPIVVRHLASVEYLSVSSVSSRPSINAHIVSQIHLDLFRVYADYFFDDINIQYQAIYLTSLVDEMITKLWSHNPNHFSGVVKEYSRETRTDNRTYSQLYEPPNSMLSARTTRNCHQQLILLRRKTKLGRLLPHSSNRRSAKTPAARPSRVIVRRNRLGIIMSVSTFGWGKGAHRPNQPSPR